MRSAALHLSGVCAAALTEPKGGSARSILSLFECRCSGQRRYRLFGATPPPFFWGINLLYIFGVYVKKAGRRVLGNSNTHFVLSYLHLRRRGPSLKTIYETGIGIEHFHCKTIRHFAEDCFTCSWTEVCKLIPRFLLPLPPPCPPPLL